MTDAVETGGGVVLRRYLQYALDCLLLFIGSLLVAALGVGVGIAVVKLGGTPRLFFDIPLYTYIAAVFLGSVWIEVWYPHRHGGATPAMRWLGLRITTLRGGKPPLRAYLLRSLLMTVDGIFLCLVGAALIALTPRHQRLGDLVARTLVVRAVR
ncbi:RDD family protein [Saccharothrix coeruleofusca]|uniref:Transporter n=1 Tax=Saccharothrix coeruleofusca TaxID=33919 RepID=A0A918AS45_9PSEU|nr:RDD family protein [Saccharothrix coeruleofusca]MBP2335927.1 putative RDD family membrane protein YckC [Saccharothrix coeruleofusca]GGP76559.1 transporter [Saccharothrix coeruleofusca]